MANAEDDRDDASANGAIVLVDTTGTIAAFGVGASRLFGHSAAEAVRSRFETLVPAQLNQGSDGFSLLQEAVRDAAPSRSVTLMTKEGAPVAADLTADIITHAGRLYFVAVFVPDARPVTGSDWEDAPRVRAVAAHTAHDVNNLLWIVSDTLEALAHKARKSAMHDRIADAIKAVDESAAMLEGLQIVATETQAAPTRLDLNAEAAQAIDLVREAMGSRTRIETRLSPDPLTVTADPNLLRKALLSLLFLMHDTLPAGTPFAVESEKRREAEVPPHAMEGAQTGDFALLCLRKHDTQTGRLAEGRPKGALSGNTPRMAAARALAESCGGFVEAGHASDHRHYALWLPLAPSAKPR
jgi:nitrogen-specific signal transduction histidine kinase